MQVDYSAGSNDRRLEIRTKLRQLIGLEQLPLGIFATSDTLAADIMIAARELHLNIPADLKIIGFDDAPIARYCYPQLTTIHQDITEIASQASQHLIAAISNSENTVGIAADTIIDVHLVRRGTV